MVANYVLPGDPALWSGVSNNLALAVGRERADLILDISRDQMATDIGVSSGQRTLIIFRELVGSERRLKAERRGHPDLRYWLLAVSFGIERAQSLIDWSELALRAVE